MTLHQLHSANKALAAHTFRPGSSANHLRQAKCFIDFCTHYGFQFLLPATATVCYHVTYITTKFISKSILKELCVRDSSVTEAVSPQPGSDGFIPSCVPVKCGRFDYEDSPSMLPTHLASPPYMLVPPVIQSQQARASHEGLPGLCFFSPC